MRAGFCLGLGLLAGYFAGSAAGHSMGVAAGTARADWEWARMLENGMVGPGTKQRPGGSAVVDSITINGGT